MSGPRVVAVLSGGGAKAAAHLGALQALREAGLEPARYVGTSLGAVVAAAIAAGHPLDELVTRLSVVGRQGIARATLAPVGGLFLSSLLKGEPLRRAIATYVGSSAFAALACPVSVTAVDLESGALALFGAGGADVPLVDALYASCALPLYFPPATIAGRRYGDGGLRAVLPLEPAAAFAADLVVAIDVGPGFDVGFAPVGGSPPVVRAHDEAIGILMAGQTATQLSLWRADPTRPPLVYVRPRVERGATFQIERARQYAEEGYRATREALAGPGGLS